MGRKRITHAAAPAQPKALHERLYALEQAHAKLIDNIAEWIAEGMLAGGKKVYDEIAVEHGRVFQVQEQAFSAAVELVTLRIRQLERAAYPFPIGNVTEYSIGHILDAIAEYTGRYAERGLKPWEELMPEEHREIIDAYQPPFKPELVRETPLPGTEERPL